MVNRVGGGSIGSSVAATASLVIPYTPTAGHSATIKVGMSSITDSVASIVQTNCVWTLVKRQTAGTNASVELWVCNTIGATPGQATVTLVSSLKSWSCILNEYDTPITGVDVSAGSNGTTQTTQSSGSAGNSTQAVEVWEFAAFALDVNGGTLTESAVAAGYTNDANVNTLNSTTAATAILISAYQLAAAIGTVSGTSTVNSGSPTNWSALVAGLKFAASNPSAFALMGVGP